MQKVRVLAFFLAAGLVFGVGSVHGQRGFAERGRVHFYSKGCSVCHGLEGEGGPVGPDLSKLRARRFSPLQVAQTFWNHGPIMRQVQRRKGIRRPEFHRDEMVHLLAFLAAPGERDPPGDPVRGARLFREIGCVRCHSYRGKGGRVGPDLAPIAREVPGAPYWAQRMWNHVDIMARRTLEEGVPWPRFLDDDLADLIAFLRGDSRAKTGKP
ncbi:MAG: cytochrome c [Nitrospinota bacterium]